MGNDAGIFQSAVYDKDDEEADAIWQAIDGHMDQRRRVCIMLCSGVSQQA